MKKLLSLFGLILFVNGSFAQTNVWDDLDQFLALNVKNNKVNYEFIQKSQQTQLFELIQRLGEINFDNENQEKAALINLYNLFVIKQVIENYPVSSPMKIPGFFDQKNFLIKDKSYTLNQIENDLLRKKFKDNRLHFALVCGAISCPPLQPYAYKPKKLEEQLNEVTHQALKDDTFIRRNPKEKSAKVSEIFRWYIEDFGKSELGIKKFINDNSSGMEAIQTITFYSYDWSLNDQTVQATSNVATYTPSALLRKGQIEVQIFNNLYTQTAWRDETGTLQNINGRGTWNTMLFTFNYGVSKNGRFNLGLDVNLRSARTDVENSNSIDIFKFEQNSTNRTTISTIGPKIKWNPIAKIPKFSIQSSLLFPVSDSLENKVGRPWTDWDRATWWTQFFFDKLIGTKYQLFAEADLLFRIPRKEIELNQIFLSTPLSVFFSYFPTGKSTIYAQYQYAPTVTSWPDYFMQAGIGGKYQLFPKLQVELSYTNFFASRNNGAGNTYNVGLRYIR